jgi:hypothetical protein
MLKLLQPGPLSGYTKKNAEDIRVENAKVERTMISIKELG